MWFGRHPYTVSASSLIPPGYVERFILDLALDGSNLVGQGLNGFTMSAPDSQITYSSASKSVVAATHPAVFNLSAGSNPILSTIKDFNDITINIWVRNRGNVVTSTSSGVRPILGFGNTSNKRLISLAPFEVFFSDTDLGGWGSTYWRQLFDPAGYDTVPWSLLTWVLGSSVAGGCEFRLNGQTVAKTTKSGTPNTNDCTLQDLGTDPTYMTLYRVVRDGTDFTNSQGEYADITVYQGVLSVEDTTNIYLAGPNGE